MILERIILDSGAKTNNAIGGHPDSRTVEQRLASGFILLDKPAGPTSHQVASWVRDLFGLERLGHGGTLDRSKSCNFAPIDAVLELAKFFSEL